MALTTRRAARAGAAIALYSDDESWQPPTDSTEPSTSGEDEDGAGEDINDPRLRRKLIDSDSEDVEERRTKKKKKKKKRRQASNDDTDERLEGEGADKYKATTATRRRVIDDGGDDDDDDDEAIQHKKKETRRRRVIDDEEEEGDDEEEATQHMENETRRRRVIDDDDEEAVQLKEKEKQRRRVIEDDDEEEAVQHVENETRRRRVIDDDEEEEAVQHKEKEKQRRVIEDDDDDDDDDDDRVAQPEAVPTPSQRTNATPSQRTKVTPRRDLKRKREFRSRLEELADARRTSATQRLRFDFSDGDQGDDSDDNLDGKISDDDDDEWLVDTDDEYEAIFQQEEDHEASDGLNESEAKAAEAAATAATDGDLVRCSCGARSEDDQRPSKLVDIMVQCTRCSTWQHAACAGFEDAADAANADDYVCYRCISHIVPPSVKSRRTDVAKTLRAVEIVASPAGAGGQAGKAASDEAAVLATAAAMRSTFSNLKDVAGKNFEVCRRQGVRLALQASAETAEAPAALKALLSGAGASNAGADAADVINEVCSSATARRQGSSKRDVRTPCLLAAIGQGRDQAAALLLEAMGTRRAAKALSAASKASGELARDLFGYITLVHACSTYGNPRCLSLCLAASKPLPVTKSHGTASTPSEVDGTTPLMRALEAPTSRVGCDVCVDLLLVHLKEADAKHVMNHRDHQGQLAAHYATDSAVRIASLVAAYPDSTMCRDTATGAFPLHHAAASGSADGAKAWLAAGADVCAVDRTNGWPALLYADFATGSVSDRVGALDALLRHRTEEQLRLLGKLLADSTLCSKSCSKPIRRLLSAVAEIPRHYDALNGWFGRSGASNCRGASPLSFLWTASLADGRRVLSITNRRNILTSMLSEVRNETWPEAVARDAVAGMLDDDRAELVLCLTNPVARSSRMMDFGPAQMPRGRLWPELVNLCKSDLFFATPEAFVAIPLWEKTQFEGEEARGPGMERELVTSLSLELVGLCPSGCGNTALFQPADDANVDDLASVERFRPTGVDDDDSAVVVPRRFRDAHAGDDEAAQSAFAEELSLVGRLIGYALHHGLSLPSLRLSAPIWHIIWGGAVPPAKRDASAAMEAELMDDEKVVNSAGAGAGDNNEDAILSEVLGSQMLQHLSSSDGDLLRSLRVVMQLAKQKDNDSLAALYLDCEATSRVDASGELHTTTLMHDGEGGAASVMLSNAAEYVYRLARFKTYGQCLWQCRRIARGLDAVLPREARRMLESHEAALLLAGESEVDVAAWRSATKYTGGYHASSAQIRWFWELMESLSHTDRRLVVWFATGSPSVPVGGFAASASGFTIMALDSSRTQGGGDLLPTAATCFHLLRLPRYATKARLERAVLLAVRHGSSGFATL
ncbi:HECT-type E3 ubiquitin transferase [Pseudoscourfieldia marina]